MLSLVKVFRDISNQILLLLFMYLENYYFTLIWSTIFKSTQDLISESSN